MHGEDEVAGGVEEDVPVTDAQDGALAPQHDGNVGVGEVDVTVKEADVPGRGWLLCTMARTTVTTHAP